MKVRLPALCLLALALSSAPRPATPAAAAVGWSFVVAIPDLKKGLADVDWTLRGLPGQVQVCADMDGAERYVKALYRIAPSGAARRIERPSKDAECWVLDPEPGGRPLRLRYRYDLAALAAATGDPDYASRLGDDYIFNDETLLLRPDPLPAGAPIEVELRLPPGVSAATPWQKIPGAAPGGQRYRYDSDHYGAGSYVAIGRLRDLGEIRAGGGVASLHVIERRCRSGDDTLRRWVEAGLQAVARFYGELPGRRVHVLLVPAPGSDEPGVFGTVLRRGPPSVVLYLGAEAEPARFQHDWVAVHELFHLGNPRVQARYYWFIEGFTTYYQDVLRGRGGGETPLAMWGDLHDGFRRHCGDRGPSLHKESEELRRTHHYTRVYWGGACVAFLLDVAIRERTQGRSSLDDVLRTLRQVGQAKPLSEDDIIAALDQAAGRPMTRALLDSEGPLPIREAYRRLGIEPTGPDAVRLREDAPLAAVRRGIM